MTFQPRMQNRIEGFAVGSLHRRAWNGIVADLWDVECGSYAGGHYVARDPRLFIVLDHSGKGCPTVKRSPTDGGGRQDRSTSPISYVPADMELWVDIEGVQRLRHLDLHFDATGIGRRLMEEIDPDRLNHPNLLFADASIMSLAELIAKEIANPTPLHDLYGDSLCLALIISALKVEKANTRRRSALAPWQLRRATEFIEAHCLRNIRLEELAELTGLSQSHFSHSFKVSTGMAPHQWQVKARLDKAKALLTDSDQPLTAIAAETGFADQAHFTRVFRQHIGTTPARWKRTQIV
ncbi:helix-turn-helix domain-containing protein [Rhizobiales bacterium RZME27]|jgi:AraC family transcriptional regulator|uniref:Helix-turn-helix domain-containing protein n=1 Tax=Endobacterium cereale TaxID=2663029 RepID=A0A6A8ACQ6_9HYPH|nr:AraC family transcriptional regulator [Endobacterium cereale]MEB2845449.1 AraC family transcriptional regulator [Endobacterium cereale]MQY48922.1 helix-turn-helix domain-containing protein [Endobacterium cereale]